MDHQTQDRERGRKTGKRGKRGGDSFAEISASGNEREGKGGAKRNNNGDYSTSIIVALISGEPKMRDR